MSSKEGEPPCPSGRTIELTHLMSDAMMSTLNSLPNDFKMNIQFSQEDSDKMTEQFMELSLHSDPSTRIQLMQDFTRQIILDHLPKMIKASGADPAVFEQVEAALREKTRDGWVVKSYDGMWNGAKSYLREQRASTSDGRGMDREMFQVEFEPAPRIVKKQKKKEEEEDIFACIVNHTRILKDVATQTSDGGSANAVEIRKKQKTRAAPKMQLQPADNQIRCTACNGIVTDEEKKRWYL